MTVTIEVRRARWRRSAAVAGVALVAVAGLLTLRLRRRPHPDRLVTEAGSTAEAGASGGPKRPPGPPLLGARLPELRAKDHGWPQFEYEAGSGIDTQPLDRVLLYGTSVAVREDDDRRPLARRSREPEPERSSGQEATVHDGAVFLVDAHGGEHEVGRGDVSGASVVGGWCVWRAGETFHARRIHQGRAFGRDHVYPLGGKMPVMAAYTTCRAPQGDILALPTTSRLWIFLLRESDVEVWGSLDRPVREGPAFTGPPILACDDGRVRVAWAASEPQPPYNELFNTDDFSRVPREPQPQRVAAAECTAAGCSLREAVVHGVGGAWASLGGWSSPIYAVPVAAVNLGSRVLLQWDYGALMSRLAPLEDLDHAPTQWIADRSTPKTDEQPDPNTVVWARTGIYARGSVALLLIVEQNRLNGFFLIRYDATGSVSLLEP